MKKFFSTQGIWDDIILIYEFFKINGSRADFYNIEIIFESNPQNLDYGKKIYIIISMPKISLLIKVSKSNIG